MIFWWETIMKGHPTRHLKAEISLLMMREFWSVSGQQVLPKCSLLAKKTWNLQRKIRSKFSNTVLGYKKGPKVKYFQRFKNYNISAFKCTFKRPSMCLRSPDKSCFLAGSVSKNLTFKENRPLFTTKIDFFNLLHIVMGWSLSSLDRLRRAVSTLK